MQQQYINNEWYFKFGENINDEKEPQSSGYAEIGLPHSFGIPYYGENDFYVGYGCYKKSLIISQQQLQSQVFLEFGAVFQVAEIFVNGAFALRHEGGYTAFICDITQFIKEGDNYIFVRVNNNWSATIAPRAGEHTFNGGIYRDVKLLSYPKSHIDWYGVYVKTKKIDDTKTALIITTETVNCSGQSLCSCVSDSSGATIAKDVITINSNICEQTIIVSNAILWDTNNPYMYTLTSATSEDSLATKFGIRYIKWTKDEGFFLNGKHLLLQGANVHQDHGGWGDATTHTAIARDVGLMKECGFNFIRGSHYPHHTEFAKECDKQGMLFWSESVFWGIGGFGADGYWDCSAMPLKKEQITPFENSLKQTFAEMVRTNRNSPSIICWSIGNEMFFSDKKTLNNARILAQNLVDYSHSIDTERPSAIGGVQRGGFDIIGDIAGYNGDGAVLFKNPPKPNMVAEYGSIASYRPGEYSLYETKGSDEYYNWRAGRCIWCGFHHGSIAGIGNLGIVDLYRIPLRAWYAYREKIRGIAPPTTTKKGVAHHIILSCDKATIVSDGTDDSMLTAAVYNEQGERVDDNLCITFEVTSGGGLLPTGKKMVFDSEHKNYFDGMCACEIRSYYAGKTTIVASANGIVSNEVAITILGDNQYNNNDLRYPIPPKTLLKAKVSGVDILNDRPVTVSSERIPKSSICLSTKSSYKCWQPLQNDITPNILLDLEHNYSKLNIILKKEWLSYFNIKIYTSIDGVKFSLDKAYFSKRFCRKLQVSINNNARYVKICFEKDDKIAIKRINIYEDCK